MLPHDPEGLGEGEGEANDGEGELDGEGDQVKLMERLTEKSSEICLLI